MCVDTSYSFSIGKEMQIYVGTEMDIDIHVNIDLTFSTEGAWGSNFLLTVSTAQMLATNGHGPPYEPELLRQMADLRALAGKGQFERERIFVPKDKEVLKV